MNISFASWKRYVDRREEALVRRTSPIKTAGTATVGANVFDPGAAPEDFDSLRNFLSTKLLNPELFFLDETISPNQMELEGTLLTLRAQPTDVSSKIVIAQLFEARSKTRQAVILLPHWNAPRRSYEKFGRILAFSGITCLQITMPYHDERVTAEIGYAREMACENLSLTIQSNRQAVIEVRACLSWLQNRGYDRFGVVGISIGSSIASIAASIDPRIQAVALLLMADDFGEVIWTGSATRYLKASLEQRFTFDEIRSAWAIISPRTYARQMAKRAREVLILSADRDTVFIPISTKRYVDRLLSLGGSATWRSFQCGHYTLGILPYSVRTMLSTLEYLKRTL
jgi:hypothetical protein